MVGDIKKIDKQYEVDSWRIWFQYLSAGDFAKFVNLHISGKDVDVPEKEDIEINWPSRSQYGDREKEIIRDRLTR